MNKLIHGFFGCSVAVLMTVAMIQTAYAVDDPVHEVLTELEYQQSELRLNTLYAFLKSEMGHADFIQLKSEQVNWLKERQQKCGGASNFTPQNFTQQTCYLANNQMRNSTLLSKALQLNNPDKNIVCKNASTTADLNHCATLESRELENQMNLYLFASKRRYSDKKQEHHPKILSLIETAQNNWVRYKDAECSAVYTQWMGGTIRGLMSSGCQQELTRERIHTIWLDFLTYEDSTTPILPEPKYDR